LHQKSKSNTQSGPRFFSAGVSIGGGLELELELELGYMYGARSLFSFLFSVFFSFFFLFSNFKRLGGEKWDGSNND